MDTQLHTRFAIFLYALQLETALLTRSVFLDAADAERSVTLLQSSENPEAKSNPDTNSTSAH